MRNYIFVVVMVLGACNSKKEPAPAQPPVPAQAPPQAAKATPAPVAGADCSDAEDCVAKGVKLLESGGDMQEERRAAEPYLEKGCKLGSQRACNQWAATDDVNIQHQAYEAGCKLGDTYACGEQGLSLWTTDGAKAAPLLERACNDHVSTEACMALMYIYRDGAPGVEKDSARAEKIAALTCKNDRTTCRCDGDTDCGKGYYCITDEHRCYANEVQ